MVKARQQRAKSRWFHPDALYATGIVIWIIGVWGAAIYVAREAIADESAGMGGNSFLLAASVAMAGLITAFSVKEFLVAYRRFRDN